MKKVTVAVSSDFFTAFSRIPRKQQTKVLDFVNKFRANPSSSGINYEKIKNVKDKNLRSVRIDRTYRGIVLKPESGNVYVLLWVDHHDSAYRWAEKRIVTIHPETGSLQIVEADTASFQEEKRAEKGDEPGLFEGIHDRQLLRLGIPQILLPVVRGLKTERDLDKAEMHFPQEAAEALYMLAAGYSYEEILRELERKELPAEIDTSNFQMALIHEDSRRRFMVVEDDLELEAMLNAPLEKWRVFLHPTQRKLVERDWNGPVRVLGGAGTGKTVVALHRAKWLAQRVFTGRDDRILFTTFTRNLAADIQENLKKICPYDVLRRIEVINLDKWVSDFLQRQGYKYEIDYGTKTKDLWEKALILAPAIYDLSASFYRQEWEKVIQPQEIKSASEYMKASRLGRGGRLNRKARKAIWPVFQEYIVLLDEYGLRESEDAMRDARLLLEKRGDILPYSAIVVDEAQDMSIQAFRLIYKMIPGGGRKNDLFIVGDAHQRIYRHKVVLSRCGINIRGRSRRLRINYRTTEENRKWATALLKGIHIDDLDGGTDDQKGYKSLIHGIEPTVKNFETFQQEVDFIAEFIKKCGREDEEGIKGTCLVARTKKLLEQYKSALEEKGLDIYFVRRSRPEDRKASGVRLATMHRVKGLEFERVIIAAVNEGVVPLRQAFNESSSDLEKMETEIRERALLYVAATRAKREVLITSFGQKSCFL